MTKVSQAKNKITKEELMEKIYKKIPSLQFFPKTWRVGRYPRQLSREQIIQLAKELKIILRVTKRLVKYKDRYTLEENIVFTSQESKTQRKK